MNGGRLRRDGGLRWRAAAFAAWVLAFAPGAAPAVAAEPSTPTFAEGWLLVRLSQPVPDDALLAKALPRTGIVELDRQLAASGVRRIERAFPAAGGERLPRHGLDRVYRFHVPAGTDVRALVERFGRLPGVEYAEPDWVAELGAGKIPDDPEFSRQWAFDQYSDVDVDGPEAWLTTTGRGVVLGVLDSGIDTEHPDLAGQLVAGHDFVNDVADADDDNGHGSRVASIAAARADNGVGMAGACWDCRLMPLKVADSYGQVFYSHLAEALVWAVDRGARVLNVSAGGREASPTLLEAVAYAYEAGATIVSITHNQGTRDITYPGKYVETLAVGATDAYDVRRANSNYGPRIDVVAPGEAILGAALGGGYEIGSGTSFAAPLVTGMVGLLETVDPSIGREEARHLLRAGSEDGVGDAAEDTPGFDIYYGWGRVNMARTLKAAASSNSLRVEGKSSTSVRLVRLNPVAESWDFIRGDLRALTEGPLGVDLGPVTCLANDSSSSAYEVDVDPTPGAGFFYLARFNAAAGSGSWGGSSRHRDRHVFPAGTGVPDRTLVGIQGGEAFGRVAARAGDVDGDGHADIVVGAPSYDGGAVDSGAARVYLGGGSGLSPSPAWTAVGEQAGSRFGEAVASAGDVNGDGYDDVVVGAPLADGDDLEIGRAAVYLGSAAGLSPAPARVLAGGQSGAGFGAAVASAGDVDGDGYDDLLVVAPGYDAEQQDEGRVELYRGSPSGPALEPSWSFRTAQHGATLGSASSAGDVNGDGYDDVIVGSPGYDGGDTDEGRVWVFLGSAAGLAAVPDRTLELDRLGARFGCAVGGAGDVDGDGYDEVIAGACGFGDGEVWEGAAFVYAGSPTGVGSEPTWQFESDQEESRLGITVGGAGDVNGDGFADVVVGAPEFDRLRSEAGRVWVFAGSAAGLGGTPLRILDGEQAGEALGQAAAIAGDIDGDGYDDLITGAGGYDAATGGEGRVTLHRGPLIPPASTDCPADPSPAR